MALDANGKLIEETSSGGRPYVAVDKNINAQRVAPAGRETHSSVSASATTAEAMSSFNVEFIIFIINDGDYDIIFNIDANTTSAGAFTLKSGEGISDFPRKASTLYYKAENGASGSVPFRALGVK